MDRDFLRNYVQEDITAKVYSTVKDHYNDNTATTIYDALDFASTVHKTQTRSGSLPFILHPMRVALLLVRFDSNVTPKVFMAALLHDTLESGNVTREDLEDRFGHYVAELVQSVTVPRSKTARCEEGWEAKQRLWRELLGADHESRSIKTFENLDNMLYWQTIPINDPDRAKIPYWLEEIHAMSLPLARATNVHAYEIMQQEYLSYAAQGFTAQPRPI